MTTPPDNLRVLNDSAIPEAVTASPSQMPGDPVEEPPWWKPTLGDLLRQLGWRWIFLLPAALVFIAIVASFFIHDLGLFLVINFKLIFLAGGIAFGLAAKGLREAMRLRKDPFCIHCGYNLTGLPDGHRCPECGRPYSWAIIAEYRRDPLWFIQRWRERHKLPEVQAPFEAGAVRGPRRRDGT